MKQTLKQQITEAIEYYSLGDEKGNRKDLAIEDAVNAIINRCKAWALECVEKDSPYVEEGYNVGNENWLDYNARITQENRLKQEIREKIERLN